jgi:hypothetical protein
MIGIAKETASETETEDANGTAIAILGTAGRFKTRTSREILGGDVHAELAAG